MTLFGPVTRSESILGWLCVAGSLVTVALCIALLVWGWPR